MGLLDTASVRLARLAQVRQVHVVVRAIRLAPRIVRPKGSRRRVREVIVHWRRMNRHPRDDRSQSQLTFLDDLVLCLRLERPLECARDELETVFEEHLPVIEVLLVEHGICDGRLEGTHTSGVNLGGDNENAQRCWAPDIHSRAVARCRATAAAR